MPSPSDRGRDRDWRLYAHDMERFALRAVSYCTGLDRAQFETNHLMQDAVLRNSEPSPPTAVALQPAQLIQSCFTVAAASPSATGA